MKSIEQKVIKFIDRYHLLSSNEKILIALSGGPDSVFALHFFQKFKKRFKITLGAAHINHGLRGKNSDKDEEFCKAICEKLEINIYSTKVKVKEYAASKKASIEEAARELRYSSLKSIAKNYKYDKIITAHTINDNTETILLNLIKGTGLKGISGIPIQRGNIIRPFLILSKEEILAYLKYVNADFRQDESNKNIQYERNFLRHKIIPLLKKKINPSLEKNLFNSSQLFRNSQVIVSNFIKPFISEVTFFSEGILSINLKKISQLDEVIFGEILKESITKNFNKEFCYDDFTKIESLVNNRVGKNVFLAGNLIAVREREKIVVYLKPIKSTNHPIKTKLGEETQVENKKLKIHTIKRDELSFDNDKLREVISADNLGAKFILRRWSAGDKFIPLGMKNFKNVANFLTEQKVPAYKKKEQLVLLNRNNIVWVVGLRIDDRYKIIKNTKRVCELWMN
ncbi:MAG: tRNA lysidine(34) synthetase TilS [Ignavibacteriales bacterium]|nr:tRNA lysidine(34) synthetase TilS [Ignavibacteriales bacterium]